MLKKVIRAASLAPVLLSACIPAAFAAGDWASGATAMVENITSGVQLIGVSIIVGMMIFMGIRFVVFHRFDWGALLGLLAGILFVSIGPTVATSLMSTTG